MRLIVQNLLMCNAKGCRGHNKPLLIQPQEVVEGTQEFNPDLTRRMLSKLDWGHLTSAASALGQMLPESITEEALQDENTLRLLHHVMFNLEVQSGVLQCSDCGRVYPVEKGIPNMVLEED